MIRNLAPRTPSSLPPARLLAGRLAAILALCLGILVPARAQVRVGFVDPALPRPTPPANAAALAFAQTQGTALRLRPLPGGGWRDPEGRVHAPEEFDVLWYHEAGDPAAVRLDREAAADLLTYLDMGGTLLLSGGAGCLLNDLGIERATLRVLGPSRVAHAAGIVARPERRSHAAFVGLDVSRPLMLTHRGGGALADFVGTGGPSGTLLADGTAGPGERPLVEYVVGEGRVLLVAWRLADFTAADDPYRENLERLFGNLLRHLARRGGQRLRLVPPPGAGRYVRLLGVPFLRSETPVPLTATLDGEPCAVLLTPDAGPAGGTFAAPGGYLRETPLVGGIISAPALGLTLTRAERPVTAFLAARERERQAAARRDQEQIGGLRVIKPVVRLLSAPLRPLRLPRVEESVLLGRSPEAALGDGPGDVRPVYMPLEEGGFRIPGGRRRLNHAIVHGRNRLWTGDVPIFRMEMTTAGDASHDDLLCLWPRAGAPTDGASPCAGTLRLGVPGPDGEPRWLDDVTDVLATLRPGSAEYELVDRNRRWKASVVVTPALDSHGLLCRVEFDRPTPLVWQYGGIWWSPTEVNANQVEIRGSEARLTEPNLPNGLVLAAWDGEGAGRSLPAAYGQQVEFRAAAPRHVYHIAVTWGVTRHDEERALRVMARLDTPGAAPWPAERERLKRLWFESTILPALEPEHHLRVLLLQPEHALRRAREWWNGRREEFQVRTPDPHLNALVNWARGVGGYRPGPGDGSGTECGGDHAAVEERLRLAAALQAPDGAIPAVSGSLSPVAAGSATPDWVDQVWRHYTWTGYAGFLRDLWPAAQRAVTWQCDRGDPDGDGLFRDTVGNSDLPGQGPKSAAASVTAWAMLDRAARIAAVVRDPLAEARYRALADRTRRRIFAELWRDEEGRLGSVGADGIWRGHPRAREGFLAIHAGLLDPEQGRRAMRWIVSHYGFQAQPDVHLLASSDGWPIGRGVQWVPTGDTCRAALAGIRGGDPDQWWPVLRTAALSAFRSESPGMSAEIGNTGAGEGDRNDAESAGAFVHAAVSGLFGIEPAIHQGRIDICPSFPSEWTNVGIRTPDISYEYRLVDDRAYFRIHTPKPLVKRVRAGLTGREVVTPRETDSVVLVPVGRPIPPPEPPWQPPGLAERDGRATASDPPPLTAGERERQVLFDLSGACNLTLEEMVGARFTFDDADDPAPLMTWRGNPALTLPPSPRVVEAANGARFLTAGRPRPMVGETPKNLLALSSWPPYPIPGGAVIPVGLRCERLWLLLQSYVHPTKNYIPNGEVVLRYAEGEADVESLIPPLNLDAYFQHFSRAGIEVPLGVLGSWPAGRAPLPREMASAHADALALRCDPTRELTEVEIRATCSEGVLGVVGMTAVAAP
ncbi:MAG: hypothetical protein HY321_04340 [Armatimonadetes bacterium]|nr:hypothetical protein [Armatimonadota bacterium]